jgi:pyridinium-3,5-biscarboxylic acid mononucleotide sulfurtransferase
MINIYDKEQKLKEWFDQHPKVIVALSGGVDSCLVAFTARKFLGKDNVLAVISNSASLKERDLKDAEKFCSDYDISLEITDAREIDDPNYASNPIDRCFFCKSALYNELQSLIKNRYPDYEMLNGNNFSDLGDYRPGLKAASEFRALSPLAECGFDKNDIRELSLHFNLFVWDKPASPCLSSRFPYGESITVEKLMMVEDAEEILYDYGFKNARVRHLGDTARIEVPSDQISVLENIFEEVKNRILNLGFTFCEIDKEGFVSGKLNRILEHEQ